MALEHSPFGSGVTRLPRPLLANQRAGSHQTLARAPGSDAFLPPSLDLEPLAWTMVH